MRVRFFTVRRMGCLALVLMLVAGSFSGCSRLETVPPLERRVVVLDVRVPEDIIDHPYKQVSYWLRGKTHFQDSLAGSHFADSLSSELHDLRYLEQVSRYDLKNKTVTVSDPMAHAR